MRRPLKEMLGRLEQNAHSTMNDSKVLINLIKGIVEQLEDGVEISLKVFDKEMPIKIKVNL